MRLAHVHLHEQTLCGSCGIPEARCSICDKSTGGVCPDMCQVRESSAFAWVVVAARSSRSFGEGRVCSVGMAGNKGLVGKLLGTGAFLFPVFARWFLDSISELAVTAVLVTVRRESS